MTSKTRIHKIENQIHKIISLLLHTKIRNIKLIHTTITNVNISKDLSCAKIYYRCLVSKDIKYINKIFKKLQGFFRFNIAKLLNIRIVPNVNFIYDNSFEYETKIKEKITQAINDDLKIINNNKSLEINTIKYKRNKKNKIKKLR